MGLFNKSEKSKEKDMKKNQPVITYDDSPMLKAIKPKEQYVFHSDYFQVDDGVATIMSFIHKDASKDGFSAFWGINKIPTGLGDDIVTICFEQTRRMTEGWVAEHQSKAEGISQMNENEQSKAGTNTTKGKSVREATDLETIAMEIQDGASYLHTHYRLLVKAKTLESLEDAVAHIERLYIDRFATLTAAAYHGDQRHEMSTLFSYNRRKRGKGYYFTSTEFAGSYSLVTHGFEDPDGEYVGYMVGDVNNAAVIFNVDSYRHHVVIANEDYNERLGRVHVSDMWGSKISQSCLLNNGRVVHIVLSDTNLDKLGPKMAKITNKINMNSGDVNMFEMFGKYEDELTIFPMQIQKLVLMAEELCESGDSDRALIRGSLEDIAIEFYEDNRMWHENAQQNRDKIRVVGIPHNEVPKLQMFVTYLDTRYTSLVNSSTRDDELLHAINVLRVTFKSLLSNNGDLFNTTTSDIIDTVRNKPRVIYDFSSLMLRGSGVAMAQLVNVIGFAIGNLGRGDTVVIHGVDLIDDSVKKYITTQFSMLYNRGGRVALVYNNIDKMLADKDFNEFDKCDYAIFGSMTDSTVARYQQLLGKEIPADLAALIATRTPGSCYIRRRYDNVVFKMDLSLGFKKMKEGGN